MKTSSRNGFGTILLFHRLAGPGLYEATVWAMAFYIPIFPRSSWFIRPQGYKLQSVQRGTSTTHFTEFLERRNTPWSRIFLMYCGIAGALIAMWGPLILGFVVLDKNEALKKTWLGAALVLGPLLWSIALWVWLEYRRDCLYKNAVKQAAGQEISSAPIN